MTYIEVLVTILDQRVRKLWNKEVASVKMLWWSNDIEEVTWEVEEEMRKKYPHLFATWRVECIDHVMNEVEKTWYFQAGLGQHVTLVDWRDGQRATLPSPPPQVTYISLCFILISFHKFPGFKLASYTSKYSLFSSKQLRERKRKTSTKATPNHKLKLASLWQRCKGCLGCVAAAFWQ